MSPGTKDQRKNINNVPPFELNFPDFKRFLWAYDMAKKLFKNVFFFDGYWINMEGAKMVIDKHNKKFGHGTQED